jgi:hypothetical protein
MQEFEASNSEMAQTFRSHLLSESTWADILQDDYERFLYRRAEKVSKELQKRVIPQDVDAQTQEVETEDLDAAIEPDIETTG